MQLTRLALVATTVLVTTVSCGGASIGDEPHGQVDAPVGTQHDAPPPELDAPGSIGTEAGSGSGSGSGSAAVAGIGTPCTPGTTQQGDCSTGFVCLQLQGSTGPWCSKQCSQQADTCPTGYSGPGVAQCILTVTPGSASDPSGLFCDVICEDDTGTNGVCPAGTCNDTCPGIMSCSVALGDGNGNTIGKACF